jgi:hypothetical protein
MPARPGHFEALPAVASSLRDHVVDRLWTAAKPAPDRPQDVDEDLSRPRRGEGAVQGLSALVGVVFRAITSYSTVGTSDLS